MKTLKLGDGDREFLGLVAEAAFSNPFSDERRILDQQIAGKTPEIDREELLTLVTRAVSARLRQLRQRNAGDLSRFRGQDRQVMRIALLFEVFHMFVEKFDRLILDQIAAGPDPCTVPFATEIIQLLVQRGFSLDDAAGCLAMFFQIRRAYYFIDHALIGRSSSMKELRRRLWNNVFTSDIVWYERFFTERMEDFSTLLLGETGTGKGTAAAAIGQSGFIPFNAQQGRFACSFTNAFIALNLSQFPEALVESELFGHRKGAFTGAVEHHHGVLSRCSPHGAIFLDEIGEVAPHLQIKLLQVLQERTFSPVGSHELVRFEGRVITATNQPIEELRESGKFRNDFFYRLCSDIITVPPLHRRIREDQSELDDLLDAIIRRMAGRPAPTLRRRVRETIRRELGSSYLWPGNVRELEQAARRILLTGCYTGDRKTPGHDLSGLLQHGIRHGTLTADELLNAYCSLLHNQHGTYEEVARRTGMDRRTVKRRCLDCRLRSPIPSVEKETATPV